MYVGARVVWGVSDAFEGVSPVPTGSEFVEGLLYSFVSSLLLSFLSFLSCF